MMSGELQRVERSQRCVCVSESATLNLTPRRYHRSLARSLLLSLLSLLSLITSIYLLDIKTRIDKHHLIHPISTSRKRGLYSQHPDHTAHSAVSHHTYTSTTT
jgi:hypothetical protein